MKGGRSGVLKPDRLGLSCKASKCSDTGTRDLGVLTTHETSLIELTTSVLIGDACSTRPVQGSKYMHRSELKFGFMTTG